ncbi:MAG: ribbon-helix-helix protein, CopG family [Candidatus Aenigmarchaeota archaeon]|nr:ribbon-helix-helix protein, CopG family [Candidatus Aenigmarchaeota archaeon]
MKPVQVRLTEKILGELDRLVKEGSYPNRSEALRDAARRMLMELRKSL